MTQKIQKLLIAQGGELSSRIQETCSHQGVATVAIFSEADKGLSFVESASEAVCVGPGSVGDPYLNVDAILSAARHSGADTIHPGCGALAERADFADAVRDAGLTFVGPQTEVLQKAASPAEANAVAEAAGVSVVSQRLRAGARQLEVPILGDQSGNIVRLFELDCFLPEPRQKPITETPAPRLRGELRETLWEAAIKIGQLLRYQNVGTVEFVIDAQGQYFFKKINPRLPVAYRLIENTTGINLVEEQLRLAAGHALGGSQSLFPLRQDHINQHCSAIEARLCLEASTVNRPPRPVTISYFGLPMVDYAWVDSAVEAGSLVPSDHDSTLVNLIAFGASREKARLRLIDALRQLVIHGVTTNRDGLIAVLGSQPFCDAQVNSKSTESSEDVVVQRDLKLDRLTLWAAAVWTATNARERAPEIPLGFRVDWRHRDRVGLQVMLTPVGKDSVEETVQVQPALPDGDARQPFALQHDGDAVMASWEPHNQEAHQGWFTAAGHRYRAVIQAVEGRLWVSLGGRTACFQQPRRFGGQTSER